MALKVERQLHLFSMISRELVNSPKPLTVSSDNQLLVCLKEEIQVFTISCDLDAASDSNTKFLPCNLFGQLVGNISAPPFYISSGIIHLRDTFKHLSPIEKHELQSDPILTSECLLPRQSLGGFRHALFSPLCYSAQGFFIVAVTFDHRIFIYKQHDGLWILIQELFTSIKDLYTSSIQLPITVGAENSLSFGEYKNLIHSMACVEVVWSSVFPCRDSVGEVLFLFCAMRNGDIQVWEMTTSQSGEEFRFVTKDEYNRSEVTALWWHTVSADKGFLSIGYIDGSVRILNVETSDEFEMKEVFKDDMIDDLAINDFDSSSLKDISLLFACKQMFIVVYRVHNDSIRHINSVKVDCSLPLDTISIRGRVGTASSQDGNLYHFRFDYDVQRDQFIFEYKSWTVSCLYRQDDLIWSCKGAALTANGLFCISLFRPQSNYSIRTSTTCRFHNRQRLVISTMPYFGPDDLTDEFYSSVNYQCNQDIILHLLLNIQNKFRCNLPLNAIDMVLDNFASSECLAKLQIARSIFHFEWYKIHNVFMHSDALKESGKDKCLELTQRILARHAANIFDSSLESEEVIGRLIQWVNNSEVCRKYFLQYSSKCKDLSKFLSLKPSSTIQDRCCFCDGEFAGFKNILEWKCVNEHVHKVCCLTLSPITDMKARRCLACGTVAKYVGEIEKIYKFRLNKHLCTLCSGRLL